MKLTPCLWFDTQAEEAARFYTSVFPNSKILAITRYPEAGQEIHGKPAGSVITALNGGPHFKFTEAVSFQIECETQEEIDAYWEKLGAGGDPDAQQCGWLKDKFGLSWQVIPKGVEKIFEDSSSPAAQRAMNAMLEMKKLEIGKLEQAYKG
jgi:predicted 3-demethylubiquinone-9 3-methyltransferase (glyoxalase superfamily)